MNGFVVGVKLIVGAACAAVFVAAACGTTPERVFGQGAGGKGATGGNVGGGAGGGVGGFGAACEPGASQNCYSGPAGTDGVGPCTGGTQTCAPDGSAFGPCLGEATPALEDCSSPLDEDCNGVVLSCTGSHLWSRALGDAYPADLSMGAASTLAVAGTSDGTIDFGAGSVPGQAKDVFVAMYDASGAPLFGKIFGDSGYQSGMGVGVDGSGNVVVTGYFEDQIDFGGPSMMSAGNDDGFVAKLNPAGGHVWSHRFGDVLDQRALRLDMDVAGNAYLVGQFEGTFSLGGATLTSAGGWDAFVLKLDAAGILIWGKSFGDADDQMATDIAVSPAGDVVVSGRFFGAIDLGGSALLSEGGQDVFVCKLSAQGQHVWSARFGDANTDVATALSVAPDGSIWVTGMHDGTIDFGGGPLAASGNNAFVAKLDATGAHLWSDSIGDAAFQEGTGVAAETGGTLVVGNFEGIVDFGIGPTQSAGSEDVFAVKLGASGAEVWRKTFGDSSLQRVFAVAADPGSRAAIAGLFQGTVSFGGPTFSADGIDGYIASFGP